MDDFQKMLVEEERTQTFEKLKTSLISRIEEMISEQKTNKSQLGIKSGLSRAYITRLMNGELNPTVKSLYKIANALGYRVKITFEI